MIRSKTIDITCVANKEVLAAFLVGVESLTRRVTHIWCEQAAGADVRAYVDQDRIVDVATECNQLDVLPIPVDLELLPGKEFKVGFQETAGGTPTAKITVFWEEK